MRPSKQRNPPLFTVEAKKLPDSDAASSVTGSENARPVVQAGQCVLLHVQLPSTCYCMRSHETLRQKRVWTHTCGRRDAPDRG